MANNNQPNTIATASMPIRFMLHEPPMDNLRSGFAQLFDEVAEKLMSQGFDFDEVECRRMLVCENIDGVSARFRVEFLSDASLLLRDLTRQCALPQQGVCVTPIERWSAVALLVEAIHDLTGQYALE